MTGAVVARPDRLLFRLEVNAVLLRRQRAGIALHVIDVGALVADDVSAKEGFFCWSVGRECFGGGGPAMAEAETIRLSAAIDAAFQSDFIIDSLV